MSDFYAIIPAGGAGNRFGGATKKQFLELAAKPLFQWSVDTFLQTGIFKKIVVCLPAVELSRARQAVANPLVSYVEGGETRAESVYKGFSGLNLSDNDIILVHDAVRPLVTADLILKVADMVREKGVVIPVVPIADTVKEVKEGVVVRTLDRSQLVAVQTPQGFRAKVLRKAYEKSDITTGHLTDEGMLAELIGEKVWTVEGERTNIKITTPVDLKLAGCLLAGDGSTSSPCPNE